MPVNASANAAGAYRVIAGMSGGYKSPQPHRRRRKSKKRAR